MLLEGDAGVRDGLDLRLKAASGGEQGSWPMETSEGKRGERGESRRERQLNGRPWEANPQGPFRGHGGLEHKPAGGGESQRESRCR